MKQQPLPILSLSFEPHTKRSALALASRFLTEDKPSLIFTPNTAMLCRAVRDESTARLLNRADLLLPDGMGIIAVSRLLRRPLPCRLSGIDIAEEILSMASKRGLRVFLLGAKPGVAERAAEALKRRYPRLIICGTHHGYFGAAREETDSVLRCIQNARPHILFACLGFPKQERWLLKNKERFPSLRLGMGLGGSLDVWSGKSKRAPKVMQTLGLEWLWRALREPRRFSVLLTLPTLCAAIWKDSAPLSKHDPHTKKG